MNIALIVLSTIAIVCGFIADVICAFRSIRVSDDKVEKVTFDPQREEIICFALGAIGMILGVLALGLL